MVTRWGSTTMTVSLRTGWGGYIQAATALMVMFVVREKSCSAACAWIVWPQTRTRAMDIGQTLALAQRAKHAALGALVADFSLILTGTLSGGRAT